ncbi:Hypothetical_protein [Hexamita inflata]|uniref:Hypothetical_protein n=1 Tax=Hexamita inflata TaxID=28002 RepID=A0ABP1GG46_9EUKA
MHVFGLSNMILQTYFSAQTYSRREQINNFMSLLLKSQIIIKSQLLAPQSSNNFKIIPIIWSSQAHLYETQRERNGEENKAIENISLTLHSINQAGKSKLQNGKEGRINDFLSDEIQWRIFVANSG